MVRRIFYDGLNLALDNGTGIATYTRVLASQARDLGYETGVLHSINPDSTCGAWLTARSRHRLNFVEDCIRCVLPGRIVADDRRSGASSPDRFGRVPRFDHVFLAQKIFKRASYRFIGTGCFTSLNFPIRPDIMHFTYQMPMLAKSACNLFTIHDLVPLRLPFATRDNKRRIYRLLKKIAAKADHIVTVSEHSRRDIVELLGIDETRVTNTYQALDLPEEFLTRSDDRVGVELADSFGLDPRGYLLFFGAIEPKKNVGRLLEAYRMAGVSIPLVIVSSGGWDNESELETIRRSGNVRGQGGASAPGVIHLPYLERSPLVTLIKGARAVLLPSLYEGFGLPVLEAMALGTPVLTSRVAALPEISGDAALLVNPHETEDIARGIAAITDDADLRGDMIHRGRAQAERYSLGRYRARLDQLYAGIG